jgi:hypothetical protein
MAPILSALDGHFLGISQKIIHIRGSAWLPWTPSYLYASCIRVRYRGGGVMASTLPLDIEQLYRHLQQALRYGARASRLLRHVPDIIDFLYPAESYPQLSVEDRAIKVEDLIQDATHAIGGDPGEALAAVLCLLPGTLGRTLDHRRRIAADYLNIEADTFRRPWNEKALLFDLTIEIYKQLYGHGRDGIREQ